MIATATTMGPVYLTVADLDRTIDYWTREIGLEVLERGADEALLGSGGRLLVAFREVPGARPSPQSTGLFHVALLVPEREDLARWLAHALHDRVQLAGASDHFVSEALYLRDPDFHGIEIYADRPRDLWEGRVTRMGTDPLDVDGLLGVLDDPATADWDALPGGTIVGHTHLQVASIADTLAFYRDLLEFEEMVTLGSQATFLSAGGYHHHLALNTYFSAGAAPAPRDAAGLHHFAIRYPSRRALQDAVRTLIDAGVPVWQAGDHGYALAVYFRDPDDNGVELCWDRPCDQWGPERGELDVAAFLAGSGAEERA
jgi:catechol 2,3-dioxygenase